MKKISFLTALVLAAVSLFSCTNMDDFKSEVDQKRKEKAVEKVEDVASSFERGTVENGSYSSNFSKVKFTAPSGFSYASDDEILSMMDIGLDATNRNDELTKELLKKTTIYDMVAQNPLTGESVVIMYENIAAYGYDPDKYSVDDYLDNAVKQLKETNVSGASYGKFSEYSSEELAGKQFRKMSCTLTEPTYNMSAEQYYYVTKIDDFMMGVIISSGLKKNDVSEYTVCFESLS